MIWNGQRIPELGLWLLLHFGRFLMDSVFTSSVQKLYRTWELTSRFQSASCRHTRWYAGTSDEKRQKSNNWVIYLTWFQKLTKAKLQLCTYIILKKKVLIHKMDFIAFWRKEIFLPSPVLVSNFGKNSDENDGIIYQYSVWKCEGTFHQLATKKKRGYKYLKLISVLWLSISYI